MKRIGVILLSAVCIAVMCGCPANTDNSVSTGSESAFISTTAASSESAASESIPGESGYETMPDEGNDPATIDDSVDVDTTEDSSVLFNGAGILRAHFVNHTTGKVGKKQEYRATGFIKIDSSKAYLFATRNSGSGVSFLYNVLKGAYYDENKKYIAGIYAEAGKTVGVTMDQGKYHLMIPRNCKYVRLSVNDNDAKTKWTLKEVPKTVVWFGDSIIGSVKDRSGVTEVFSCKTGMMVYDMGFSGCRMSRHNKFKDKFSMYRIAGYIKKNDYSVPVKATEQGWKDMPKYYKSSAKILANDIDFKNVDIIIISFGTNDYKYEKAVLDNKNNKYDVGTVCGALRYSIREIRSKYPHIRFYVTSPIYRAFRDDKGNISDCNTRNFGSGTLVQYSKAYRSVCQEMGVKFIDLYNDCEISESTRDKYFSNGDLLHPNAAGRKVMGEAVAKAILNDLSGKAK